MDKTCHPEFGNQRIVIFQTTGVEVRGVIEQLHDIGPLRPSIAAVARAGRSLALMCSMVTLTPACLPNSAACWSLTTSAAGTKLVHSRTCNVLVWAKAGAFPPTNSAPAAAARAILVLRKARRVSPLLGCLRLAVALSVAYVCSFMLQHRPRERWACSRAGTLG